MTANREIQILLSAASDGPFSVSIEPEGTEYRFPPHEKVLLTFKGPDQLHRFELVHSPDALVVWRSGDTEVWASLADGTHEQIGCFSENPAPWLDTNSDATGPAPWHWPPSR